MEFYLVDVFAETKYTGNQLAVFKTEKNLSSDEMQKIAREINFSETTFILGKQGNGGYDVRIFTPEKEIPFADIRRWAQRLSLKMKSKLNHLQMSF